MSKKETEIIENVTDNEAVASVVKVDGEYFVKDLATGEIAETPCKICSDEMTLALTPNAANRKWIKIKAVEDAIAEGGECLMTFKASKTYGSTGAKLPNAKLISYLSEEEQAEYKAIIDRAKEARDAEKNRPLTDLEKAMKQLEAAKKKIAELQGANA